MRRTSSGSDLTQNSLMVATSTPYVYMAPSHQDSMGTITSPGREHAFRSHCSGCTIARLPVQRGDAFTMPGFIGEVKDKFLSALHVTSGEPLFNLPIGAISCASFSAKTNLLCFCCATQNQYDLVLDVDAPSGWLHWGPTGYCGTLRLTLVVGDDVEMWVDTLGITL